MSIYSTHQCLIKVFCELVGAIDHMTYSSLLFSTYNPCLSNRKISIAIGSLTTVAGLEDIQVTPSFVLKYVLHVPKLAINLVSIQKITKDLKCHVYFFFIVFFRNKI